MMQPAFHRKVIEQFAGVIRTLSDELVGRWEAAANRGETVNLTECMSELTLAIVLHSIFGHDLEKLVTNLKDNPFMMVTREPRRDARFAYDFRQLGRHVLKLVRQRRARGARHFDFAQMLMEAVDAETSQGMNERQITDEILTLVVAGHETTASALNWTWWLLSRHPEAERALHEEQARVGDIGLASFADLERPQYTRQVLDEALRLYPPGWLLTRPATGPDRLGGYPVPRVLTCC